MLLYRFPNVIVAKTSRGLHVCPGNDWAKLINRDDLHSYVQSESLQWERLPDHWLDGKIPLAPIDRQEVWAAGVTYLRSRNARMDESKQTGGDSFYDKVYEAERPEIFFKANPIRVSGPGQLVKIRTDSTWNVPEPELTLFMTSSSKIIGYTIGNDMSSRSIEGENPLYLPQAKVYDASAALGPALHVPESPLPSDTLIRLSIMRVGKVVFDESIAINRMKRKHEELAEYLFRACSFPDGVFLMTGTGIVPPNDFTLMGGDEVAVSIAPIGTLSNTVGV